MLSSSFFFFFLKYIYIFFCWVNIILSLSESIFFIPTYFAYEVAGIGDKLLKIREYRGTNYSVSIFWGQEI